MPRGQATFSLNSEGICRAGNILGFPGHFPLPTLSKHIRIFPFRAQIPGALVVPRGGGGSSHGLGLHEVINMFDLAPFISLILISY